VQKTSGVVELPVALAVADTADRDPACVQFEQALVEVLRRDQLPRAARAHLSACRECAAMLDDFEAIAGQVRELSPLSPGESDAVPDQWPQIREALRREGIIHDRADECSATTRAVPKLVQPDTAERRT